MRQLLQDNYDKLLHISLTFCAFLWLYKITNIETTIPVIALLQIAKTIWNYQVDGEYSPWGDWVANGVGYLAVWLYL